MNADPKLNKQISSEDKELDITQREPIEGTPFWLNKTKHGWVVTMKHYRVSEFCKTKEKALEYIWLENNGWNVIGNMIIIIHEQMAKEVSNYFNQQTAQKKDEMPTGFENVN